MLIKGNYSWAHVREIPDTRFLVSVHHSLRSSANIALFDISKRGKMICSFEETLGCNLI